MRLAFNLEIRKEKDSSKRPLCQLLVPLSLLAEMVFLDRPLHGTCPMRAIESPPPVWVQMSTAHIYGDPPEVECTEDSSTDFGATWTGRDSRLGEPRNELVA